MTLARLLEAHQARPFQAFTLRTGSGREYHVPHPEFLAVTPGGRTVVVTHGKESVEMIDLLLVESLHFGNGERKSGRGRKQRRL